MGKETDGIYYFNRCRRCHRLVTKLEVLRLFAHGGELCSCGSMMFGPTNPVGLEWLKPKVLKMCVWQILGKLAPAPDDGIVPPIPPSLQYRAVPPLRKEELRPPEESV